MKIDLFDVDEFVEINNLKEIKSGALIQRNNIKHPEGLISDEIFGVTIKSRKETFAYIDLHGHFFHPHIYKAFKRLFRNVEKIVNGELYYSIDKDGYLVKDEENGQTGLDFLYNNWSKIKWETKGGMRDERIDLLTKTPKNKVFMKYQIVIPAFYRDITGGSSSGGKTGDINNLYSRLIRYASMVEDKAIYDFQLHGCNYNIQNTIVEIYDYFKMKIQKKNGIIRQYLMGKRVDYCTREVITGPQYHGERPEDNLIDTQHAGVPLSSVCALANPFMLHYLKNFFDNMFKNEQTIPLYNPRTDKVEEDYELDHPERIYNEKFYKKMMNTYIRDPESRFNKLEIPVVGDKKLYLYFSGVRLDPSNKSELSSITYRPLTWTDVLYMAAVEVTKDKHVLVTRYPLNDEFGIFVNKIRVTATTETMPAEINGKIYKFYPVIDIKTPAEKMASKFVDSMQFSNSYLKGLGGDYDGDQITAKMIYTQEANKECAKYMNSKAFFIKANGSNIRVIENEATQTFYSITKDPPADARTIGGDLKDELLKTPTKEMTLNKILGWISSRVDSSVQRSTTVIKPLMRATDKIILSPPEMGVTTVTETTVGRILFNRLIFEASGLNKNIGFINKCIEGGLGVIEETITHLLINDVITPETMFKYIDCRDWLGLTLHGAVTVSFTPNVIKPHPEVIKLKKELLKKYRAELDAHDPKASQKIEEALINKTKELVGNDPGMDLYKSKAKGSIENNFKNTYLFRGAVQRPYDGKYDIIENSLTEGLNKKDIGAHANTIVNGAYPKSCATADSGYIAKELMAALQTESLNVEGSDCGTLATIDYVIPKSTRDFEYRYIKEGEKLVLLTPENIGKYIGKKVKLRTPQCCIGEKLCNKCAGNFFYMLGKEHAGLMSPIVATTCTNLNMKKFHENLVKVGEIDLADMFI